MYYMYNESTKVHKPTCRCNACRQRKDIEGEKKVDLKWVGVI